MKRAIFKAILFSLLILATCIAINWIIIPSNPRTYHAAKIDKLELIRNTPSPKVVLVGGSNLAFGIDSELLSSEFGMPVVNMGLSKSVGMEYLLNEAKPYIHAGDVVILCFEYEMFYDLYYGSDGIVVELQYVPSGLKNLRSWGQIENFISKFGPIMQAKFTGFIRKGTAGLVTDVYRRDGFNEYGDLVSHLDAEPAYEAHELFAEDAKFHDESIRALNQFYLDILHVGARAVMAAPPLVETEYVRHQKEITELWDRLEKELEFPVISDPRNYIFQLPEMYDTAYHLLREGRRLRTHQLLDDLERTGGIGFGGKGKQT